jgi:hypothetical protein
MKFKRKPKNPDPEYLGSIVEIIRYTGIPQPTFYKHYLPRLKASRYLFRRRTSGWFPSIRYWSYKRLILAWMVETFTDEV